MNIGRYGYSNVIIRSKQLIAAERNFEARENLATLLRPTRRYFSCFHADQSVYSMHKIFGGTMRTTLDLNELLLDEAMKITGEKTKTSIIHRALSDLVRREKTMKLLDFAGKVDISIDLDISRGRTSGW
jgi:Arc/MetJ family transcription regulator